MGVLRRRGRHGLAHSGEHPTDGFGRFPFLPARETGDGISNEVHRAVCHKRGWAFPKIRRTVGGVLIDGAPLRAAGRGFLPASLNRLRPGPHEFIEAEGGQGESRRHGEKLDELSELPKIAVAAGSAKDRVRGILARPEPHITVEHQRRVQYGHRQALVAVSQRVVARDGAHERREFLGEGLVIRLMGQTERGFEQCTAPDTE